MPESQRDRLVSAAAAAQSSGQFDTARRLAAQALDLDPTCVPAKFIAGVANARLGDTDRSELFLLQVLKAEPNSFEAIVSLTTVYLQVGKVEAAVSLARRGVDLYPTDAQAHNLVGRALLLARRLEEASSAFTRAVELQPKFIAAYYNLGKARQLEGKDGDAARAFSQAAALAPTQENLLALGHMFLTLCDFESALACAGQCAQMYPQSAAAHLLLCGALTENNQIEEAEAHLQRAIELDPAGKEALQTASRQRPLGYIEEANANLRRAIAQNPRQVSAYDALMQNHRATEEDWPLVDHMLKMLGEGQLSETEQVSIHYGLGKALEDLRKYGEAMVHYDEANRLTRRLKFGDNPFDQERYRRHVDSMIERSSAPATAIENQELSNLPILIIGMMRSGTSLAEQILSSHAGIVGAGEQLFWTRNWSRVETEGPGALGREYVADLRRFGPNARRVTDKMPGNYMFAGVIHQAAPNAKFIHMRRNPLDNCLSIWATPNHMPHEGGNNKADIAFVYKEYLRLMEHWRKVLPKDRILEIDYEELVNTPRNTVRLMLEFCGLEWDEACLKPHENKRLVATPSAWQVRQPVYRTSVERWRNFASCLGDFQALRSCAHPEHE